MNMVKAVRKSGEEFIPRHYQEEVFRSAQAGNIIAALETGSGKTFIAALLIRWISSLETSKNKIIVFLVPRVSLVEQQGDFISKHTPLRVAKLYGSLDIDLADRKGWSKRFTSYDVFVMTAQLFLNLLTHSHWSIDKISLIVFDECHHTRKNHPYNSIMREYNEILTGHRPKIFGMTASPVWNPSDAVGSLTLLEKNLDARVIGVRAHAEELAEHAPKPIEIIKEFPPPRDAYDYPFPLLWTCLKHFNIWADLDASWYSIEMRYHVALHNLGPYAAELYLFSDIHRQISQFISDSQLTRDSSNIESDSISTKKISSDIHEVEAIILDYKPFFADNSPAACIPIQVSMDWCSPKLKTLVDILLNGYSPTFQGIVFVEQRHVAICLTRILPAIPELRGLVRCAELLGQGVNSGGISRTMGPNNHQDTIKLFRQVIATAVAEEGLDFPACDLVIRYDALQHMVGYVQSRGRARDKASTFVVMVQQDDTAQLARYKAFSESEPELRRVYQTRHLHEDRVGEVDGDEEEEEEATPADLAERERFVVPSTGAILTYDNSINLLNYLCSLIPCDKFAPSSVPEYRGDFDATLRLPLSLPLSKQDLVYHGPHKHSKKEAKRAVAFLAVKRLHTLNVYDDYLLPAARKKSSSEDGDGRPLSDVSKVPVMMNVMVRDPWSMGAKLWIHSVEVDGRLVAGLVTGTELPAADLTCGHSTVVIMRGKPVLFDYDDEGMQREMMKQYTVSGLWFHVTRRPLAAPPSLFLVPITRSGNPDFEAIMHLVKHPRGNLDWTGIGEDAYDRLMIMNVNEFGRPLLLRRIRYDLSPMALPVPGSREDGFNSYYDYLVHKYAKPRREAHVPINGPLVEAIHFPTYDSGEYDLKPTSKDRERMYSVPNGIVIPQGCCRWVDFPENIRTAFRVLPALCHRITDIYRVQQARIELGLPHINDDLLVEALTIPSAIAGFSNQRMETLGDAVLQIATSVHFFNKYPYRHEGQLSMLRQSSVSNRSLLSRAKDIGLEQFITSETQSVHVWRYCCATDDEDGKYERGVRYAPRRIPRRSMQDCMEAILGAAFLTGGIPMALRTGDALGLAFGGPLPWPMRYGREPVSNPVSALFNKLQETLGYTFHQGSLLVEAVTHPSFLSSSSDGQSYQRLEFLGDAVLDLVVMHYLYEKFPEATSHQLSSPRARAICAPALASISVRKLGLHKIMLINGVELSIAIEQHVPLLLATSGADIVTGGWKHDPPKALSDVFESVIGAVFVDSAYNYERVAAVVELVMEDILEALSPTLRTDPVSELLEWCAKLGCRQVAFRNTQSRPETHRNDGVIILVHDTTVVSVQAPSLSVAKALASERALGILKDPEAEASLRILCNCHGTTIKRTGAANDLTNKETDSAVVELVTTEEQSDTDNGHDIIPVVIEEESWEPECNDDDDKS